MNLNGPVTDQTWEGTTPPAEVAWLLQNETPDVFAHTETVMLMRQWWEGVRPPYATTVRCSSKRRRKLCRRLLADVYETPYGYYARAAMMPFVEGTVAALELAHDLAAQDLPDLSRRMERPTGKPIVFDVALHLVPQRMDGMVMLGCPDHGNIIIPAQRLIDEAASTRRWLNVDTVRKPFG